MSLRIFGKISKIDEILFGQLWRYLHIFLDLATTNSIECGDENNFSESSIFADFFRKYRIW